MEDILEEAVTPCEDTDQAEMPQPNHSSKWSKNVAKDSDMHAMWLSTEDQLACWHLCSVNYM